MTTAELESTDPISAPERDPDAGERALAEIQELLHRFEVELDLAHREHAPDDSRRELVEKLVARQHEASLQKRLEALHSADIAYVLEGMAPVDRVRVWRLLGEIRLGEVLLELADSVREMLVEQTHADLLVRVAMALDPDELAALADELPGHVIEKVQQGLSSEEREQLRAAMSYPEDSVGARMDFDMVTIRDDVSLEVVLRYLRRFEELPSNTDQIFVVDRAGRLIGSLAIGRLLVEEPEAEVSAVMSRNLVRLDAMDEAIDAARAFERYDLVSAPVVDVNGRLIGRLTVDEVVDVIREEGESETLTRAGLREEEDLFAPVWDSARNRWLWLALNLCTAFFASRVIEAFEGTIERVVALAALMPVVAGIAGNSGNQTMTLITRSIAMGQVGPASVSRLYAKEFMVAILNGTVWGLVAGLVAWALYYDSGQGMLLALTMSLAILLNLLIAAAIGLTVPLMLHKMGRDPAMGASVLLTFSTDSLGFMIFLGLASLLF